MYHHSVEDLVIIFIYSVSMVKRRNFAIHNIFEASRLGLFQHNQLYGKLLKRSGISDRLVMHFVPTFLHEMNS